MAGLPAVALPFQRIVWVVFASTSLRKKLLTIAPPLPTTSIRRSFSG